MDDLEKLGLEVSKETREDFVNFKVEPLAVVYPKNEDDVIKIVNYARLKGIPIVPWGAGTSLTGAVACQGCILIDMKYMSNIIEINDVDWYVRVQPGVNLEYLNKKLMERNFFLPPDPASFFLCSVGGAVSNSSGGMRGVRYGTFRDWVLALRVVLPTGEAVRIGEPFRKNRAGYDLVHLFTGSEGTLGIITEIWLRITPLPKENLTAIIAFVPDLKSTAGIIQDMRRGGVLPEISEYIDNEVVKALNSALDARLKESEGGLLLLRLQSEDAEAMKEILKKWGADFTVLSREEWERMYSLRAQSALALKAISKEMYVEDIVVPVSKLAEAIERINELEAKYKVKMPVIAHIGDGNLHPNILVRDKEVADVIFEEVGKIAIELGGSVSGEHGIGVQKAGLMGEQLKLHNGLKVLEIMRDIKRLIDPNGIMNPGKYVELAYERARASNP
ncbi:FAD-binding protein [Metallosphaera tengchongensis]|uniref:FAD-binding protein n=1 Tax=Metallosphaera tengchongensis TaxID=1532350 RepID=A0A6N0NVB1_9CREN|nr:FAD-linked oxidase C-terminal domain-containing protein [Metallosphaera tengchongensis]QKR00145.1 FAD-binding protein [Metallosphaera tengchongensis]